MAWREIVAGIVLFLAALGLAYTKGHSDATDQATIEAQALEIKTSKNLKEAREDAQKRLDEESAAWRANQAKSKVNADRTIADLKRDGQRLSVALADASVRCTGGDGRPLADGRAELRDQDSSSLIGAGKDADEQIRALQNTIRILKGESK